MIKACQHFFSSGHILREMNCTFISLIPKNAGADSLENYRPISLCNFVYKIISKVLANRMQKVIHKIISPNQAAFIKGRSIHHNILLANDLVKDLHSKARGTKICIKADLRKAFDSVNRKFIYKMLLDMNFPQQWINWIQSCLETPKFSILFNGSPIGFFGSTNGIRQGDPLSPYLFTIAMEGLSCMLEHAVLNGSIKVPIAGSIHISHITFADDLFIFLQNEPTSVKNLATIMNDFGMVSGLQLNHAKSKVYMSPYVEDKVFIAQTLGVSEGSLPVPYLGLPLISTGIHKTHCQPILQKIKNRISSWKNRLLSKAGRLELIRSVLHSYSIYWCNAFLLPAGLLQDIERLLMNFFWNGTNDKAMHMVNWDSICKPKDEGGLNLRNTRDWNQACLVQQLWDLLQNKCSLWSQWVSARYLSKESIWEISTRTYHSAAWKGILKARNWLIKHISYAISSGTSTNMWYDPWVNGKSIFQLYGDRIRKDLGAPKDWKVSEFIANGTWCLPNPISPEMLSLWPTIIAIPIRNNSSDILIWPHDNGKFSATSAWNQIRQRNNKWVPSSWTWDRPGSQRHSLCTWQALLNKLPTIDNMKRRGIYHVNRCSLCLQQEETVDHLYFACDYTKWIWKEILQRFELNRLPQPNLHQELGDLMQCFSRKGPLTQLAKVTFRCAIWWMWKERCNRIFECQHTNNAQLLKEIIRDSRSCMEHDLKTEHFTRREKDIFIKFNFAIS